MAIQTINIGNQVNDGLGDDLRTAFQKVNANFSDLGTQLTITGANLGGVGIGIFKQKTGSILEFKSLISGSKISVDEFTDTIRIRSTAPDAFTQIDTNAGSVVAGTYPAITLQGGDDIDVTAFGSVVTVNNVIPVTSILTTFDFGYITGELDYTTQLSLAAANIDFGTITLEGTIGLDCGTIV
jgi:hypothetical protein